MRDVRKTPPPGPLPQGERGRKTRADDPPAPGGASPRLGAWSPGGTTACSQGCKPLATLAGALALLLASPALAQPPAGGVMPASANVPQAVALTLEDQFDKPAALADLRGSVVILVYGDRKGTDACKALGEQLHVCWHPAAKGLPPAQAKAAPVIGLDGLAPGQPAPDVKVVPVACCGKVPGPVRSVIRGQVARGSPEVPVWLDFGETMKASFGLTAGEPNVVVFDAAGRLRMKVNGTPDQPAMDRLVKAVQNLRAEAAR